MEVDAESSETKKRPEAKSDEYFKGKIASLSNDLKSDSAKTVTKALHYIRLKVMDQPKGVLYLYETGGTKAFYKILTTSHQEILNMALSIVGNVSSVLIKNKGFCEEMIKHDVSKILTSLLRKSTDKKIQRRICRLVGNMAQCPALGWDLHKSNIGCVINDLLMTTDCSEVKTMGLRAMRWLCETDKMQLVGLKAVKTVAAFLDSEDHQLLKLVIRTLVVFSHPCNTIVAKQISGLNGNGYNAIVSKMKLASVNVLVLNLSHSPDARVELCKAGAVQEIVDRLSTGTVDSCLITALCVMCREPMVRASLRKTSNGFKTLLSFLVNPSTKHLYPELVSAITQFSYDTPSLLMMVKGGLITALVERLAEFSKEYGEPHAESTTVALASPTSSSGSLTPPPSFIASDPMLYSPCCSSPESDSSSTPNISKHLYSSDAPNEIDSCILEVLCQLTYQGTPLPALASKTTLTTVLKYLVGLRCPDSRFNFMKATKAVSSIVKCKNYFNTILEEETVIEIDRYLLRTRHSDCWDCKKLEETGRSILSELGTAAQSGLGEGELTYRLTTSSDNVKTTTALVIPFVIEQPNLLNTLLFGHNSLHILLKTLHSRTEDAVASLHNLFRTLNVVNPQGSVQICENCEVSGARKESNISFKLDDGSIVQANRESLSHGCPMFEAMFRGGFIESQQGTVQITDISFSCLSHLTRIIDEYCVCALPRDHTTLLEMITASDRFLLPHLTTKILSFVMNSSISYSTSPDIFNWGVTVGRNLDLQQNVPSQVAKYIMVADMPAWCRVHAVKGIMESKCADEFCDLITDITKTSLQSYTKSYKYSIRKETYAFL